MSKKVIYLIGVSILGATRGYCPDLFSGAIYLAFAVMYLLLLSFVAHKFGK